MLIHLFLLVVNNNLHTGEGAEELPLLTEDTSSSSSSRSASACAARTMHLLLAALRDLHAARIPAVLLLLWLFTRSSPGNRALLLKHGGLGALFKRLAAVKEDRQLQYSAASLLVGALWS